MSFLSIVSESVFNQGQRDENQDAIGKNSWGEVHRFVVVDGMGGVAHGKEMAQRCLEGLLRFQDRPFEQTHAEIQDWFGAEFDGVAEEDLPGAVATLVDVNLKTGEVEISHLGDTRVYLCFNGQVKQVTDDHVDAQGIPNRDFGLPSIEPEVYTFEVHPQNRLIVCSDGIYRVLGKMDTISLASYMEHQPLSAAVQQLTSEKERLFEDNATAWFIEIGTRKIESQIKPAKNSWFKHVLWSVFCLLLGLLGGLFFESLTGKSAPSVSSDEEVSSTIERIQEPTDFDQKEGDQKEGDQKEVIPPSNIDSNAPGEE